MYKTALLKFEQNGKSFECGTNRNDFKAYSIEGLDGLEFDFTMQNNPQSPNSIVKNIKPLPRQITLNINCKSDERSYITSFFTPFVKGKLTVIWNGVKRWIEYYSNPIKIQQETVYRNLQTTITLICPKPYWNDPNDYGKNIASEQNLFAFPFVMLADRGLIVDYRLFDPIVNIFNNGDVEVGAKVIFKAIGTVVNPKFILNSKEYVRVLTTLKKGDIFEFNTNIDNITGKLNGQNTLNLTDPFSTFFQIPKGQSTIEYTADEGINNFDVTVYFTPQYLAVGGIQ